MVAVVSVSQAGIRAIVVGKCLLAVCNKDLLESQHGLLESQHAKAFAAALVAVHEGSTPAYGVGNEMH